MYNPNAVVNAMINKSFQSYWSQTGTYESIVPFINMNFDGLKDCSDRNAVRCDYAD